MSESCGRNDLVSQRAAWLLWGLPAALLATGALVGPFARTLLWTPALLVAGAACAVNAARCRRREFDERAGTATWNVYVPST